MASLETRLKAQEARRVYLESQAKPQDNGVLAALRPATIPAIKDTTDNLLDSEKLVSDVGLKVSIPLWDNATPNSRPDTITLQWALMQGPSPSYEDVKAEQYSHPVGSGPFELTVPFAKLPKDGLCTFRYKLNPYNGGTEYSDPVPLKCDLLAPHWPNRPKAMTLRAVEIDDNFFISNPNLLGNLALYDDRAPGDRAKYFLETQPPEDFSSLVPVGTVPITGDNQQVAFDKDTLTRQGDGVFYTAYELGDRAGNRSFMSDYTKVIVTLGPLPTTLPKPELPEIVGKGYIDVEDAIRGIDVEIPKITGAKAGDKIKCMWGTTPLETYILGSNEPDRIKINVPSKTLIDEYGTSPIGDKPTAVSYIVERQTREFGPATETFQVNFGVVGPPRPIPDPTWPDRFNPLLLKGEVVGKSGTANVLVPEDRTEAVTYSFKLPDLIIRGHKIVPYWAGQRIDAETLTITTEVAGDDIPLNIPWTHIDAGRNGTVKVHYQLGDDVSPNEQLSEPTDVAVSSYIVDAKPPTFPDTASDPDGWLTCVALHYFDPDDPENRGVRVEVPDLSEWLDDGEKVRMTWTPLLDWDPNAPETPITAAIKTEELTLGTEYPKTGFIWLVDDYDKHIDPLYTENTATNGDGRAKIEYEFMFGGTPVGSKTVVYASMHGSGTSCPVRPPSKR